MPDQLRLCLDHVPGITARSAPITDETHGFRRLGRVCEEAELGGAIALELAPSRIDRHMEFIPCEECYLSDGIFDLDRVTSEWSARLNGALSAGYEGIRVTGSTGWLQTREWPDFWRYEATLNESIADQPMTVLCTYPLVGSGGCDILDVTHTHQSAITKRGGNWEVIETAALKPAHGGRIWASPGDSVGAIFRIVLPSKRGAEG
jgi:hypothetical protein